METKECIFTEYGICLVYAKNINSLGYFREPISDELIAKVYNQVETSGERAGQNIALWACIKRDLMQDRTKDTGFNVLMAVILFRKVRHFLLKIYRLSCSSAGWRWGLALVSRPLSSRIKNNNILFKQTNTSSLVDENGNQSKWNIYTKIWLADRIDEGRVPVDLITKWETELVRKN